MIHWTSRICETCKHWIKYENECPYQGRLDRTDKHGNDMIVIDCTDYEEGTPRYCRNCKHWGSKDSPCCNCYGLDEWEEEDKNNG